MITRRSFLSALACLPFVGKYVKADNAALAAGADVGRSETPREVREFVWPRCAHEWEEWSDWNYAPDQKTRHRDCKKCTACDWEFEGVLPVEVCDPWPAEVIAERKQRGLPTL